MIAKAVPDPAAVIFLVEVETGNCRLDMHGLPVGNLCDHPQGVHGLRRTRIALQGTDIEPVDLNADALSRIAIAGQAQPRPVGFDPVGCLNRRIELHHDGG